MRSTAPFVAIIVAASFVLSADGAPSLSVSKPNEDVYLQQTIAVPSFSADGVGTAASTREERNVVLPPEVLKDEPATESDPRPTISRLFSRGKWFNSFFKPEADKQDAGDELDAEVEAAEEVGARDEIVAIVSDPPAGADGAPEDGEADRQRRRVDAHLPPPRVKPQYIKATPPPNPASHRVPNAPDPIIDGVSPAGSRTDFPNRPPIPNQNSPPIGRPQRWMPPQGQMQQPPRRLPWYPSHPQHQFLRHQQQQRLPPRYNPSWRVEAARFSGSSESYSSSPSAAVPNREAVPNRVDYPNSHTHFSPYHYTNRDPTLVPNKG